MSIPKKILETYSDIYFPKKKEHYENTGNFLYDTVMYVVAWTILGFAVYLSFKCENKFDMTQFLLALLFAPFYIIYHLAVTRLCGLMK